MLQQNLVRYPAKAPNPFAAVRLPMTPRCNSRCFFCHNEGQADGVPLNDEVGGTTDPGDPVKVLEKLAQLGLRRLTLTGGEPFLHGDMRYITNHLLPKLQIEKVHVVTQGAHLRERDYNLSAFSQVVISMHSLDEGVYESIHRSGRYAQVLENLKWLAGWHPYISFNVVVLRGLNDSAEAINDIVQTAVKLRVKDVRFFELYSPDRPKMLEKYFSSIETVKQVIMQGDEAPKLEFWGLEAWNVNGVNVSAGRCPCSGDGCLFCYRRLLPMMVDAEGRFGPGHLAGWSEQSIFSVPAGSEVERIVEDLWNASEFCKRGLTLKGITPGHDESNRP
jgi:molybdenum cofactor biosynthesis enzyme MoaA